MLGLRTEVFAQRIHRNVLGCVPITKELESAEVLETTREKAKFLGKHWMRINTNLVCPLSKRRAPGLRLEKKTDVLRTWLSSSNQYSTITTRTKLFRLGAQLIPPFIQDQQRTLI